MNKIIIFLKEIIFFVKKIIIFVKKIIIFVKKRKENCEDIQIIVKKQTNC